jgi:hypothetical protein
LVTRVSVAVQVLGLTRWERIFQDLMAFVLSVVDNVPVECETFQDLTAFVLLVVDNVPVDNETLMVTSSISRIWRLSL